MSNQRPGLYLWLLLGLLVVSDAAVAIPYCALRDPVNSIYELFPEADAYRSNVQTVGKAARTAVNQQLPFSLHFNELGRHTLYIAQKEDRALGYVHARSELGEWGLIEFAWAISPQLTIQAVKVQRSRDPFLKKSVAFADPIIGANLSQLQVLYESLQPEKDEILLTAVKSAMKTLVITAAVWKDELEKVHTHNLAAQAFPGVRNLVLIAQPYSRAVHTELQRLDLTDSPVFNRQTVEAYQVEDGRGVVVGLLVKTSDDLSAAPRELWWAADAQGEIRYVLNGANDLSDQDFQSALTQVPVQVHASSCSTPAELAALEISVLARQLHGS